MYVYTISCRQPFSAAVDDNTQRTGILLLYIIYEEHQLKIC